VSQRLIPVGQVVTTHGIKGWLKIRSYNAETAIFSSAEEIFLEKGGVRSARSVEMSKAHKGHFLVKLRGMDRIEEAEQWVGATVSVEEKALRPLEPGEYYYYQVTGFDVFDVRGEWLGVITEIWSKEGGDLYVVTGASKEYLIPAVKEMIEKIDLPERKMIINPPAGLLDL